MAVKDLDVVGTWPDFAGKVLDQLIAQEAWFAGECDDEANVVWLRVDGAWHKLYFDGDAVFWAPTPEGPAQPTDPQGTPDFPLNDLGTGHNLHGQRIAEIAGNWVDEGSEVSLRFDGGQALTFRNRFDTTSVIVGGVAKV